MTSNSRITRTRGVVQWRQPISAAIKRRRELPWGSDELVTMTRSGAIAYLDLYLSGAASVSDVDLWANALEGRDDLAFENELVTEFVDDAANPDLTRPLTKEFAQRWRDRLCAN